MTPPPPLLEVRDLQIALGTPAGPVVLVDGLELTVQAGQIVGLVGESGCGKSLTAMALLGLHQAPLQISAGSILLNGRELVGASEAQLRRVRGKEVAMIFQDPGQALNPVLTIETQMVEAIEAHRRISRKAARALALEALVQVGIAAPAERLRAYPHQLSGGMRQRVAIAIALLNAPQLVIADEPTTALDVTIQAQILHQVQTLCRTANSALLWITHDLSVVAALADQVCVMYAGRVVESGPVGAVLGAPRHPYTAALLAASGAARDAEGHWHDIPGTPPDAAQRPSGCAFHPRCAYVRPQCREAAPAANGGIHVVRCFYPLGQEQAYDR
ncbi:MAG: ABC transporter ATP-binding protein [Burkholderiaceae bacterium]|nr:ABC transporter ATP-binding protein [Burkholderiaceae bacterium]